MEGDITTVESTLDADSRFRLWLPAATLAEGAVRRRELAARPIGAVAA